MKGHSESKRQSSFKQLSDVHSKTDRVARDDRHLSRPILTSDTYSCERSELREVVKRLKSAAVEADHLKL